MSSEHDTLDGGPLSVDDLKTDSPSTRVITPQPPKLSKSRAERIAARDAGKASGGSQQEPASASEDLETRRKKRLGKSKARLLNLTKELDSIQSLLKNRKENATDTPSDPPPPPPEDFPDGSASIDASGRVTGRPANPQ